MVKDVLSIWMDSITFEYAFSTNERLISDHKNNLEIRNYRGTYMLMRLANLKWLICCFYTIFNDKSKVQTHGFNLFFHGSKLFL